MKHLNVSVFRLLAGFLILTSLNGFAQHDVGVNSLNIPNFAVAGMQMLPSVTVQNFGTVPESFDVTLTDPAGYNYTQNVSLQPGSATMVSFTILVLPVGTYCFTACANLPTDNNLSNQCKTTCVTLTSTLTQAYGYINYDPGGIYPPGPASFYLEHPDTITQLAVNTGNNYLLGGTWAIDNSVPEYAWYATEVLSPPVFTNPHLVKVNTVTGAYNNIGVLGVNLDGFTYNFYGGMLLGINSTLSSNGKYDLRQFFVDQSTGQTSLINSSGYTQGKAKGLAFSANGILFFVDSGNGNLYALRFPNKKELLGSLGTTFSGDLEMEFSQASGELFLTGKNAATGLGGLYKMIPGGPASLVGNFPNGLEMTALAITNSSQITYPIDLGTQWITSPVTGPLDSAENIAVIVRNFGSNTISGYKVSYQVGSGPVHTDTVTSTLGINTDMPHYFQLNEDMSTQGSTYCIKAWVWGLPGEMNRRNDTIRKCVTNTLCTLAYACYPNSQQEAEVCGTNQNGGCNSSPAGFVNIADGDSWCGTVWKTDTLRDADWYTFSIPADRTIKVKAKAEFEMDLELVKLPCSNSSVLLKKSISKCSEDNLIYPNLPAGTYALKISPSYFSPNLICSKGNRYAMNFIAGFCIPGAPGYAGTAAYIKKVNLDSINNISGFTAGGYADYTGLSTSLGKGKPFAPNVLVSGYDVNDSVTVFVDCNQNDDFSDAGEAFKLVGTALGADQLFQGVFSVPANIATGARGMRVRVMHDTVVTSCGDYAISEAEDYTLNIVSAQPHITTTLGSLSGTCLGMYEIPITVDSCYNIQEIHYNISVSPGIMLSGLSDINPLLNSVGWNLSQMGNQIYFDWFSLTPISPGSTELLKLLVNVPQGTSFMVWTPGADSSYYANGISGFLASSWIGSTLSFTGCSDLGGKIYYAHKNPAGVYLPKLMGNMANTCDSVQIYLKQGNTVVNTACAGVNGDYLFQSLLPGNYTLLAGIGEEFGGLNAIDAQAIQMNMVNYNGYSLGPIYLKAGDVNVSGGIPNSVDALLVMKRFVGLIPNFMPPVSIPGALDWYSETPAVSITGAANVLQDIHVLCAGDVNGSMVTSPPPKSEVMISHEGSVIGGNEVIDVPVYTQQALNIGSISLVLNYPISLKIDDVFIQGSPENLVYLAKDGQLRLAWCSLKPIILEQGDVLLTMKVRANQIIEPVQFESARETILSDGNGNIIEGASFLIPEILPSIGGNGISLENVPNPFSSMTEIRYNLPISGKISLKLYNILGEEISVLFEGDTQAGFHTLNFDGTSFGKGIYFYQLKTEYGGIVRRMVISD